MADDVISVLTYKSVDTVLAVGGSQSWALNPVRARGCKYAVLCRNANTRGAEDSIAHGTAFMIGLVSGIVPSTDHDGRWLIQFSGYAVCNFPDEWQGRNPVAYWSTDEYEDINFDALEFLPMPGVEMSIVKPASSGFTIAEAKRLLAESLGVQPSAVEITIRG